MVKVVFLAGGSGERFWPLSRKGKPKQFLKLLGENSLLRESFLRIQGFVPLEDIYFVSHFEYIPLIREEIPEAPKENLIAEPVGRNTAAAIALGAFLADPEDIMVVLPSDHFLPEKERFLATIKEAVALAQKGYLVTVGIKPTRPETGYGYIELGKAIPGGYLVSRFREKPSREMAEEFIQSGKHLWNAGMFIWKVGVFLEALKKHLPGTYERLYKIQDLLQDLTALSQAYEGLENISVDFAVLEKAENVAVVPGEFAWSDVGSWISVAELLGKGESWMSSPEKVTLLDCGRVFIWGNSKELAIIGLENLGFIETEDAILILDLDKAQDVKKIVPLLKDKGKEHLL